jgi:hypothetical protein
MVRQDACRTILLSIISKAVSGRLALRAQITFPRIDSHSANISGGCQFLPPTDCSKTNYLSYEMASPSKRRRDLDSHVIN